MAPKAEDAFWRTLHQVTPGGLLIDSLESGFGNKPGDVEKSFGAGAANSVGSAVRGVGAFGDSATRSVTRLVAGEKGVTDYQRRRAHGNAPMPSDLLTAIANPLFQGAAALKKGVRDTALTRVSETAGNIAPGLAVSVANPYAGAAFFAAQGADSQNQAAIRAGKAGTWQADLGVLGNAGAQGALGLIPGVGVERYLPKLASPVANAAVRVGSRTTTGAASGASSNVVGNLIEKYTVNPDKDIWDGTPESAILGGSLGAAHAAGEALPGRGRAPAETEASHPEAPKPEPTPVRPPLPAAKATTAILNHHTLTEAVRTARTSKLRGDDPARFQAFTAKVADAAEVPPIQVAPDVLDSVLATPEGQRVQAAVPDLPERVVAARDAGTDVSMSAHEYLTHVGPELHDQIAGDVRVGPDAMTPAEAVADHQARVAALQSASAEAEASALDPEAFRQSRQALTDLIRQHYDRETVGRLSPDQRAQTAELAGHVIAVEAAKQGVEPMEMYGRETAPERPPMTGGNIPGDLDGGPPPETVSNGVISDFPANTENVPTGVEIPSPPDASLEGVTPGGSSTVIDLATRDDYRAASRNPTPNAIYRYNGLAFVTDHIGRAVTSEGELTLGSGGQRFYDDRLIGYPHNPDAVEGDIGFHAGGDQFGFPGGALNVFPGNAKLNSAGGAYGKFEQEVLRPLAADPDKRVRAKFERVFYDENLSTRPDEMRVTYTVDGIPETVSFFNTKGQ